MQIYDCTVRLNNVLTNEVPKKDVSAPEVILLRHIHGGDESVINLKPTKSPNSSKDEEYERLVEIYGASNVLRVFGPKQSANLPTKLKELEYDTRGK